MNWTPDIVDGMCSGRVGAVTGRSSPASCGPATVTADDTPTESGCDERMPCNSIRPRDVKGKVHLHSVTTAASAALSSQAGPAYSLRRS